MNESHKEYKCVENLLFVEVKSTWILIERDIYYFFFPSGDVSNIFMSGQQKNI